jgi:hypothetical protein
VFRAVTSETDCDEINLVWGFQDTSSNHVKKVRYGSLQLATPLSNIPTSSTVNSAINLAPVSVSVRSPLILEVFRRRPPLVVHTSVMSDRSLQTNGVVSFYGVDTITTAIKTSQRVQLWKYVDFAVTADLTRNEVFDKYFKRYDAHFVLFIVLL